VLSSRGRLLTVGSVGAAVAGLVYGVEEFVLLATSAWVLLAIGALGARRRRRALRRALRLVVRVPAAEVAAGQPALVELRVSNAGRHRLPPVVVEEPRRHWSVSFPGLGARHGAVAGAADARDGRTGRSTTSGDSFAAAPRRSRRERAAARRVMARSSRLPDLAPGADAALWIAVPTAARGLLTLSGVALWCEDPFRLFGRRITTAPPAHVVVYPTPAPPGRAARGAGPHPAGRPWGAATQSANTMSGDELSGLRPYAPGDRLTRLHWPALARSGELVVREFVEPRTGSLTLLVDVRPSAHDDRSIDEAISLAAGLGIEALQRAVTVELCTSTGDRVVVAPNTAGRQTLLRALAMLGPASPAPAVARRWGDRTTGGAVWASGNPGGAEVLLVTTARGAAQHSLPDVLGRRAETVLVP